MALIECRECGKEISKKAEMCPNCGSATKSGKKVKRKERHKRKGHFQGAGCILIIIYLIRVFIIVALPFAILIGIIGVILSFLDLFV